MPPPRLVFPGAALALLAVAGGSCWTSTSSGKGRPPLALTGCHVAGLAEQVRCGVHRVQEDRGAEGGRTIDIHVAVLPALRRRVEPDPLILFAGGPGQGARDFAGLADRFFRKVRRTRDIVLIDLRGTGASNPLECAAPTDELAIVGGRDWVAEHARQCASALSGDPRLYTHAEALADVDEVRQRLGYARVNLWGGSWGTRAALLYALRYPGAVRSVVLDGAVPVNMGFPRSVSADAQRALDLVVTQCRADPACAARFPDPMGDMVALTQRLAAKPVMTTVRHPRTGALVAVSVTREAVLELVRSALYAPGDTVMLPFVVRSALDGDFAPLLAMGVQASAGAAGTIAAGTTMSVLCSEDIPSLAGADLAADAQGSVFGTVYADTWQARCASWPAGSPLSEGEAMSAAPALILSGDHDPITPPRWGEAMARHFNRNWQVTVPAAAHNTSFTGCVPDLIAAFVSRGDGSALDRECLTRSSWPTVVLGPEGPRP
jgi:pimeloyl-ACP methyl ester carboxylesterase